MATQTMVPPSHLAALRRAEAEAKKKRDEAERELTARRVRLRVVADELIPEAVRMGDGERVLALGTEAAELEAVIKKQTPYVEACEAAQRLAEQAAANAGLPVAQAEGAALAESVEQMADQLIAQIEVYAAAWSRYQALLRTSTVHTGSVVGCPGLPRPRGMAWAILRLVTAEKGLAV